MLNSAALNAQQLTLSRDDQPIFVDVNIQLSPGQALHVVGNNGVGKTSLLRTLLGLTPPTSGQVLWCGHAITEHRELFYQQLAYIGHQAGIKLLLTPLENVYYASQLTRADARELLLALGIRQYHVPCQQLSAGQQRRVALACLLAKPAVLWLLDEPFTALDKQGVSFLAARMQRHLAQQGMIVFTSHQELDLPFNSQQLNLELPG